MRQAGHSLTLDTRGQGLVEITRAGEPLDRTRRA